MASPTVTTVYPANADTNIPVGAQPYVEFDILVDLKRAKEYWSIVGTSEQFVSGPQLGLHEPGSQHRNPFYLTKPGLQGAVAKTVTDTITDATSTTFTGDIYTEAAGAAYKSRITFAPDAQLGDQQTYTSYLLGDTTNNYGISKRTVYDPQPGGTNSTTSSMKSYGGYTGTADDTINIEVTTAGAAGSAYVRWWWTSNPTDIKTNVLAQRRWFYIDADLGLQVQFRGTLVAGDTWTINCYAPEYLAANYSWTFDTANSTYTTAPTSPSTPTTSTPPSSVYPDTTTSTTSTNISVSDSSPESGEHHVSIGKNEITITFSAAIDAATITTDTVKMFLHPALGLYQESDEVTQYAIRTSVSGNVLTISW